MRCHVVGYFQVFRRTALHHQPSKNCLDWLTLKVKVPWCFVTTENTHPATKCNTQINWIISKTAVKTSKLASILRGSHGSEFHPSDAIYFMCCTVTYSLHDSHCFYGGNLRPHSSGMWGSVVWFMGTDVLEQPARLIFIIFYPHFNLTVCRVIILSDNYWSPLPVSSPKIWGFHSHAVEDLCLLGYVTRSAFPLKMKRVHSLESAGNTKPVTQCHMPEDLKPPVSQFTTLTWPTHPCILVWWMVVGVPNGSCQMKYRICIIDWAA
jgi:hypothetical protein